MPESAEPIAAALNRIADEIKRYNDRNEPIAYKGEAEFFKATYEREDEGSRELGDFLRGIEPKAESGIRRSSGKQDGRGTKASRGAKRPKR